MGDILTLVERAQERSTRSRRVKLEEKLRKATFTLEDMLEQIQQVQKMGPMGQVMGMIPGMGNWPARPRPPSIAATSSAPKRSSGR